MYKTRNVKKWHNYSFKPEEYKTAKDFVRFARNIKAEITDQIRDGGYTLRIYIRGCYYISGFVCGYDDRCVYFNISDVRYEHDRYNRILVREARNDHDYTGGRNVYVKLDEIGTACKLILSTKSEFAA